MGQSQKYCKTESTRKRMERNGTVALQKQLTELDKRMERNETVAVQKQLKELAIALKNSQFVVVL